MPGQQRAKGSGTIRERIGKSGRSWEIRYDGPSDATGKRRQVSKAVYGTRKEAEGVLRERLARIENGGFVPKQKETVSQFMERWLDTYAATNTTARTQEGYRGNIKRYIAPAIGNIELQKLTGRHIQGMYAELLKRGLGARTVLHAHRVLQRSFESRRQMGTPHSQRG